MKEQDNKGPSRHKAKTDHIVLWQTPNLPIFVWLAATILGKLIEQGTPHKILGVVAFGAIFTWAWLELTDGTNYFRRALGLAVLIFSIYNQVT